MIVVIGAFAARPSGVTFEPAGVAASVALAAAAAGARVEVVARIGDDPPGDALLLALARDGVGHVATLRDPARPTVALAAVAEDLDDGDPAADPAEEAGSGEAPAADPSVPSPTLDAADVDLALRYLDGYRTLVLVHPTDPGIVAVVAAAASWAGATLVVLAQPDEPPNDGLPPDTLVLAVPLDGEGTGALVGRYAAAIEAGIPPAEAFAVLAAGGEALGAG